MSKYIAGWNMPGYLSETEPAEFKTFYEALSYITEELLRYVNELYDGMQLDDVEAEIEEKQILGLKKLEYPFMHKLGGYIFWIQRN